MNDKEPRNKNRGVVLIINALIWAGAMLATAYYYPDLELFGLSISVPILLLVPFTLVNGFLVAGSGRGRKC